MEVKNELERVQLDVMSAQTRGNGNITTELLKQELNGEYLYGTGDWIYTCNKNSYKIGVDGNVNIVSIWTYNNDEQKIVSNKGTALNIGEFVDYNVNGNKFNYSGGWRIFGVEDKKIKLVSSELITENYVMTSEDAFNSKGIEKLNTICSDFSDNKFGSYARTIKAEDIDIITGYKKEEYGSSNNIDQYGNEVTYWLTSNGIKYVSKNGTNGINSNIKTFNLKDIELAEDDENSKYTEKNTTHQYSIVSRLGKNSIANKTILYDSSNLNFLQPFWLGNEFTQCTEGRICWGLNCVFPSLGYLYGSYNDAGDLWRTDRVKYERKYGVRAIVILDYTANINKNSDINKSKDGLTKQTAWNIESMN